MTDISLSNYEYDFSTANFLHTGTSSGMIQIEEPSTLLNPKIYFRIRPTQSHPMGSDNLIWIMPRLGESGDSIYLSFGYFSDWSLTLKYGNESLDITPAFQLGVNYSVTFAFGGRADNGKAALSVVIINEDTKQQEYFGSVVVENYPLNGYKRLWLRCNTNYIVDYAGKSRLNQTDSATTLSSLYAFSGTGSTNAKFSVASEPVLDTLSFQIAANDTLPKTLTPSSGIDGYNEVTVSGIANLESNNIVNGVRIAGVNGKATVKNGQTKFADLAASTALPTTIFPDSSYNCLNNLTISSIENLEASNIKNGVTIAGVTGNVVEANLTSYSTMLVSGSTFPWTITPDSPYNGFSEVSIAGIDYLEPENIKAGVTICNVTGTYSGSTPTLVTKTITENGTYSASSDSADGYSEVTVSVSGGSSSKFGVSMDNIFGNVDSNGVLGSPSPINGITFTGVTEISSGALKNAFKERVPVSGLIAFPDLTTIGDNGLNYAFADNQITSVDLSALTTIGDNGLNCAFYRNPITSVDLSSLTTIPSGSGLNRAFYECSTITSVDLSNLTIVGNNGLEGAFPNNQITSVDLSNLTTVGDYGLNNTFPGNQITSVDLSSLTTIGYAGLVAAFAHNTDSQGQTTLTSISFPALTSQSFGESTNQFDGMLEGDEGVVVHFPFDLESTMSSWDSVINGFGGTNTTVLFDLNGCELTFNITPNTGNRLSVNGDESSSNTHLVAKSSVASYQIYNSSYGLYISEYTAPDADSATVTVDITTPTYNTISLDTGVSGLTATINVDDIDYPLTETGTTGVYTINLYKTLSGSVSVNYLVSGGSSYMDENGTLTFNNSDISETITMRAAIESQFVRPNLTSDGTLGGNSFAVDADSEMISEPAFYAVDDDVDSACRVDHINYYNSNTWLKYTFYNPVALKTTAIGLKLYNIPETPSLTFEASDDNMNWTTLTVTNTDTSTDYVISSLDNTTAYRYYKIILKPANEWHDYFGCGISDITITATCKVPAV